MATGSTRVPGSCENMARYCAEMEMILPVATVDDVAVRAGETHLSSPVCCLSNLFVWRAVLCEWRCQDYRIVPD